MIGNPRTCPVRKKRCDTRILEHEYLEAMRACQEVGPHDTRPRGTSVQSIIVEDLNAIEIQNRSIIAGRREGVVASRGNKNRTGQPDREVIRRTVRPLGKRTAGSWEIDILYRGGVGRCPAPIDLAEPA